MEAIWLLVGLVLGAALAVFVMRERLRADVDAEARLDRRQEAFEQRQSALEQLVAPLKDQLGRVDTQLQALDRERLESRGALNAQLRHLSESSELLRRETGALVTALRKPNARGQWGQMQLRKVVELAGMVRHCDFTEQASLPGVDGVLRPDLIVNLPGGKHIVVDAKAPLQGVLDAQAARTEQEREAALRDHARLLRKHVKALADKAYWASLDSAPDLVVMFLPGESLYAAALEVDPELIEDAMAKRVLIATPTTLMAMLQAIAYGWQQERVAESARAVAEQGRELHTRLVRLSTLLARLGARLSGAVEAYNETIGSYEARVLPGARRFAEHGVVPAGSELPEVSQVAVSPRVVGTAVDAELDQLELEEPELEEPELGDSPVIARRLRAAE